MGIAWNKNRALFLLGAILQCDMVILLEDDSFPTEDGWEQEWIQATQRWGHANFAGRLVPQQLPRWRRHARRSDHEQGCYRPVQRIFATALLYGGYFDLRFRGYGQEHVEHTRRLLRVGYGGSYEEIDGEVRPIYKLLKSCIEVTNPQQLLRSGRPRPQLAGVPPAVVRRDLPHALARRCRTHSVPRGDARPR